MSNHIIHLLHQWYPDRDNHQWILGTIYLTQGSSYRKAGSHMLFNDVGQRFGLLSGGCLEADLQRKAMQASMENRALTVQYDTSDEDDMNFSLGLGCGGIVDILLQPINSTNNYLNLTALYSHLKAHQVVQYRQKIPDGKWGDASSLIVDQIAHKGQSHKRAFIDHTAKESWLVSTLSPTLHLLIVGGGADAQPMIAIAAQLGWETTLVDPRPANARLEHFGLATRIEKSKLSELIDRPWMMAVNAAVIMSHSVEIDADALQALSDYDLDYCALLGPMHRQNQVLEKANLTKAQLQFKLAGPAGLDIGAELPEGIALAILAECHAVIFKGTAKSLSGLLD